MPEVKVVDFAKQLVINKTYVQIASLEWLGQFYAFLHGQRELWAADSSIPPDLNLRHQAIIRLVDEPVEHIAPFDGDDRLQVFLPVADGHTNWLDRCVEPALLKQEEARVFLEQDLGLKEPDNVDEIERQILPLYATEPLPEPALHQEHMAVLVQTHQNKNQSAKLVKLLKKGSPKFIRATATDANEEIEYVNYTEAYLPDNELAQFLEPTKAIRYVDQNYYGAVKGPWQAMLAACGVRTAFPWARATEAEWDEAKRLQLRTDAYQGDGTCTEELRLKDYCMDGLEEFLAQPARLTVEKSRLLWNVLIGFASSAPVKNSAPVKKALTGEYLWKVGNEIRHASFDTQIRILLETIPWLPGPSTDDGSQSWKTVPETAFNELPADYEKASAGARFLKEELRWKSSWEDEMPPEARRLWDKAREWEGSGIDLKKVTEQQAKAKELKLDFEEIIREAMLAKQAQQNREALVNQAPPLNDQKITIQPWGTLTSKSGTPSSVAAEPLVSAVGETGTPSIASPAPAPDSPLQAYLNRIGRRGEELVWGALQEKYAKPDFTLEDGTLTCLRYHDQEGTQFELEWGNDETRTSVGYDFIERRKMKDETSYQSIHYHEVKASEDFDKIWFEVSEAQWQKARDLHSQGKGGNFTLWLVQGAFKLNPVIIPIPNPVGEWQAGRLSADPVRVGLK